MTSGEVVARRQGRRSEVALLAVLLLAALVAGAAGWWQYAFELPPRPPAPSAPTPNGQPMASSACWSLLYDEPDRRTHLGNLRRAIRMEWQAPQHWVFPRDGSNPLLDLYDNGYPRAAETLLEGQPGVVRKTPSTEDFFLVLEFAARIPSGAGWSAWRSAAHVQEAAMAKAPVVVRAMSDSDLDAAVSRCEDLRSVWPSGASFAALMCVAELTETHRSYSRKPLGPYTWERFLEDLETLGSPRRRTFVRIRAHYDRLKGELGRSPKARAQVDPPGERVSKLFNSEIEDFLRVEVLPAELEMLEIYLRAHRFKRQEGRFPASLSDIRANVAPELLRDPWGNEYRFQPRSGDLIVYSLGPDMKDDRGRSARSGDLNSDTQGDLILGKVGTVAAQY